MPEKDQGKKNVCSSNCHPQGSNPTHEYANIVFVANNCNKTLWVMFQKKKAVFIYKTSK